MVAAQDADAEMHEREEEEKGKEVKDEKNVKNKKKKNGQEEEVELSEEDARLKENLEMMVTRLEDTDQGVVKLALTSLMYGKTIRIQPRLKRERKRERKKRKNQQHRPWVCSSVCVLISTREYDVRRRSTDENVFHVYGNRC